MRVEERDLLRQMSVLTDMPDTQEKSPQTHFIQAYYRPKADQDLLEN
jgi:hypothetical protein